VGLIEVEFGIYVHVNVQPKGMTNDSSVATVLIIRVVASDDIRVFTIVTGRGIVVFTSDPN
jgi:hypothetical protein